MKLRTTLREDKAVFDLVHPQKSRFKYVYHPDFRVVLVLRLSQWCYSKRPLRPLSYFLTMLNDFLHGVWVGPRVEIGPGLFLGHPRGLVMNPDTKIGRYCSILQQVTIGGPNIVIGDFVEINAGAKLISNVRGARHLMIGDHTIIAAGAVVLENVPECSIVAGVPGRVVKTITPDDDWLTFRKTRVHEGF